MVPRFGQDTIRVLGPFSPFASNFALISYWYCPGPAGVFLWSIPSHVSTIERRGSSPLPEAGDTCASSDLRMERKRIEVFDGDVTNEDTSSNVAPSRSFGSWTRAENSSGPSVMLYGIGAILSSRIFSSGSGREALWGLDLAELSSGEVNTSAKHSAHHAVLGSHEPVVANCRESREIENNIRLCAA